MATISTGEIVAVDPARMLSRMYRHHARTRRRVFLAPALALALAAVVAPGSAAAADAPAAAALRFHTVTSADGVPLNVVETGPADGAPMLFVHGIGQSWLSWRRQLEGPLAARLRLVALDLRGHGDSGKPWDPAAYREACRWAEDLRAVQKALGLEKPVLVAWSFGGLVAMHYLRCAGSGQLGGLVLVATAAGRLVTPAATGPGAGTPSPGAQQAAAAAREMTAPDLRRNLAGARSFAALMTARAPDAAWPDETVAALLRMPAYVRRAMGTEIVGPRGEAITGNADLAPALQDMPFKVVTGGRDALSDGAALAAAYQAAFPRARVEVYAESGHSPFAEEAARFDAGLEAFVSATAGRPRAAD
jgi:pimeloyl-ACP methyl ester carboxylesterase